MEERRFYIYEYYIKDTNEVFYVGKGTGKRYKEHRRRNKMFLDFYSTHDCDVRIVRDGLTETEAYELEHETIIYYLENTDYRLTNQSTGGDGGFSFFSKTQAQLDAIERRKGMPINVGENNPMFGKTWHEGKTKEEIKEIYERIANANRGRKASEESRAKMSEGAKNRGMSDEIKAYQESHKREVIIVDKETLEVVATYNSLKDAKGNPYVKGHLSNKCRNKANISKDKYYIMYTSYRIDERDLFAN